MNSIRTIQAMRGLAAIAVAFYHVYIIARQVSPGSSVVMEQVARHGFMGVNFFFVLSGFIILMAHEKDIGQVDRLKNYISKRALRIYPAYWMFTTLYVIAAFMGLGSSDFSTKPLDLLSSYALFQISPDKVVPPLKVAWTLFYEVQFYIAFSLLIISRRLGFTLLGIWFASICVGLFSGTEAVDSRLLSPWNVYFFVGMAAFALYKRVSSVGAMMAGAASACLLLYYFLTYNLDIHEFHREYGYLHFLLAPAFGLLILGVAGLEKTQNWSVPYPLQFLGDASYSIYLVHSAVISVAAIVLRKIGLHMHDNVALYFVVFASSVIAGCAAYLLVERPLTRRLKPAISLKASQVNS